MTTHDLSTGILYVCCVVIIAVCFWLVYRNRHW